MKRFYKVVSTMGNKERGYAIQLDGKAVKTPCGNNLLAPNEDIAEAIAQEWRAQKETIQPDMMPITQIMVTALDRVSQEREAMTKTLMAYLDTDLICYRAETPAELRDRQEAAWDVWLSWFEKNFRYMLELTYDLKAVEQPEEAHVAVERRVRAYRDLHFTVLQNLTSLTGSLVLALAFVAGAATSDHILRAIYVEEDHKAEIYHEDKHGRAPLEEKKREAMKRDLEAAHAFINMLS
jgi:chaperone required for assembly of F1-ATPase